MPKRRRTDAECGGPVAVGVDGSAYADVAAVWAAHEALRRDTELRLVTVAGEQVGLCPDSAFELLAHTEASLADSFPGLKVHSDVVVGDPARGLQRVTGEAAVLAVGARGSGGFTGLALGSVSLTLAAAASCPLVVVPSGHAAAHPGTTVVGVARDECAPALGFGLEHAARTGSGLRVVHAWAPFPPDSDVDAAARRIAESAMGWLKTAHAERRIASLEISILRGGPGEVLAALSAKANLLALGAHRHEPSGGVGPVLHEVLLRCRCPVALVPIH